MTWDQVIGSIATLTPDKNKRDRLLRTAKVALGKGQAATVPMTGGRPPKGETRADGTGLERGSNNVQHILRRLARERPDVLDRYEAGEFKSARAAAMEAGIISQPDPA